MIVECGARNAECRMKNKYAWVAFIVCLVPFLDQITKHLVETRIRPFESISVIPGFFHLTHVRNRGAAFSLFSTRPDWFRGAFFITITLTAIIALAVLIRKTHERLLIVAFALIVGGAAGNLIDRIRYGAVVDFIDWYVRGYHWPAFNVADSAITIGVGLLAIDMLLQKSKDVKSET